MINWMVYELCRCRWAVDSFADVIVSADRGNYTGMQYMECSGY